MILSSSVASRTAASLDRFFRLRVTMIFVPDSLDLAGDFARHVERVGGVTIMPPAFRTA